MLINTFEFIYSGWRKNVWGKWMEACVWRILFIFHIPIHPTHIRRGSDLSWAAANTNNIASSILNWIWNEFECDEKSIISSRHKIYTNSMFELSKQINWWFSPCVVCRLTNFFFHIFLTNNNNKNEKLFASGGIQRSHQNLLRFTQSASSVMKMTSYKWCRATKRGKTMSDE